MKTLDINTIAFEYLLRTDSQKNNTKSEEITRETVELRQQEYFKSQKSLLAQLYDLEEEDLFL